MILWYISVCSHQPWSNNILPLVLPVDEGNLTVWKSIFSNRTVLVSNSIWLLITYGVFVPNLGSKSNDMMVVKNVFHFSPYLSFAVLPDWGNCSFFCCGGDGVVYLPMVTGCLVFRFRRWHGCYRLQSV